MMGSALVYSGFVVALVGLVLRLAHRARAWGVTAAGATLFAAGFLLPAPESRVARIESRLDEFAPAWQFREVHSRRIAAPPERVFDAIRRVRADEILLFRTLTWIRRGGRRMPANILDAGEREPLVDVAIRGGFLRLADDPPREIVIGLRISAPPGTREPATPDTFRMRERPPAGTVLAVMSFAVRPDADGTGSIVTTQTRVFASGAAARRRFAAYWRAIYPGSALIRRMWLRAIDLRAIAGPKGAKLPFRNRSDSQQDAPPELR